MIKTTRNILTPKSVLHIYDVYDDGTSCLTTTTTVKYIIMGREFADIYNIPKAFGMPSDWFYKRVRRYWYSHKGFPDTWRELVGLECFDPKVIHEAKRATAEAAKAIIKSKKPSVSTNKMKHIITRYRRLGKVLKPYAESVRVPDYIVTKRSTDG